jgi:hypothetical protein
MSVVPDPVPPVRPVPLVRPSVPAPPNAPRPPRDAPDESTRRPDDAGASSSPPGSLSAVSPSGPQSAPRSGPRSPSPAEIEFIRIVGWPDPVIDRLGYDPRSLYVETFWLGILGPTCTWLMRRLVTGLDEHPAGFDLDLAETARALGLGGRSGRHSPFRRALARCVTFEMARREGPATLAVRRRIPPLPRRHLLRLSPPLQERHAHWTVPTRSSPVLQDARRNAGRLALGLLASGTERPEAELQLVRWKVHPALAHEAVQWAWTFRPRETKTVAAHEADRPT